MADPVPDQLASEADELREAILATRAKVVSMIGLLAPDGSLRGPFEPLLATPAIGQVVQRLGLVVRSGSELDDATCEAVILTLVHDWECDFEWDAHRTVASAAGVLGEEDIDRIADGRRLADDRLALACEFALQQTRSREPDAATKTAATELLGERGVVELTVLVSYYELVCRLTALGGTGA